MVGAKAIAQRAAGGTDDNFQVVQLPFSVAMTEAYTKPTQWIGDVSVSALAAAGLLRIAAVGSGSIAKAKFPAMSPQIQDWVGAGIDTDAGRALQIARSASGLTTALVGMKAPSHVRANLAVAALPAMARTRFEAIFRK